MTSTFTPYVRDSHIARRKADAARALLRANPAGTEVVYLIRPKAEQPKVSATLRHLTATAVSKALGVRGTTRVEGDLVYGILYRMPSQSSLANPARLYFGPPSSTSSAANAVSTANVTVTLREGAAPSIGPAPTADTRTTARTRAIARHTAGKRGPGRPSKYNGSRSYEHKLERAAEFFAKNPTRGFQARQVSLTGLDTAGRRATLQDNSNYAGHLRRIVRRLDLPYRVTTKTTSGYAYVTLFQGDAGQDT